MGVRIGFPNVAAVDEKMKYVDAALDHGLQDGQRAADVVVVVADGIPDRVADREPRGEMHHGVGPRFAQRGGQARGVANVPFDECHPAGGIAGGNRVNRGAMAGRQVVVDDDLVVRGEKRLDRVAADIARAARDQHSAHGRPIE